MSQATSVCSFDANGCFEVNLLINSHRDSDGIIMSGGADVEQPTLFEQLIFHYSNIHEISRNSASGHFDHAHIQNSPDDTPYC